MVELGQIEEVDIRTVWPNEAADFTPWLADNLDLLGEELGLDLELDRTEAPVGNFSLDILARDANSNAVVAIENQIAGTDHVHLGQLMTYAAGYDAGIVIWVSTEFRDEHRAALDWINQRTDDSLNFFGVEVEAVRIGDSLPALLLRLAASPNAWSKRTRTAQTTELTDRQKRYVQFWRPLLERLKSEHGWNIGTENKYYEYVVGSGFSNMARRMRLTWENEARVELMIQSSDADWNKAVFDLLKESQERIEADIGAALHWDRGEDTKSCRIGVSRNGSLDDSEEELDEIRAWMIDNVQRFRPVFRPYLEDALSRV